MFIQCRFQTSQGSSEASEKKGLQKTNPLKLVLSLENEKNTKTEIVEKQDPHYTAQQLAGFKGRITVIENQLRTYENLKTVLNKEPFCLEQTGALNILFRVAGETNRDAPSVSFDARGDLDIIIERDHLPKIFPRNQLNFDWMEIFSRFAISD